MNDNVYLAIDPTNGAIMSYTFALPDNPSRDYEYVEATSDELLYLNSLEDHVLPAGSVVTIKDLEDHRVRVGTAKANTGTSAVKPLQQPCKNDGKPVTLAPEVSKERRKASFIDALKQYRSTK